jgi:hypothetical protein
MYLVKDTPIIKNKKLFKVGGRFPYSESDKHLLWNLNKVKEAEFEIVPDTEKVIPNENVSKTETPNLSAKSSKATAKKKTISKNIKRK